MTLTTPLRELLKSATPGPWQLVITGPGVTDAFAEAGHARIVSIGETANIRAAIALRNLAEPLLDVVDALERLASQEGFQGAGQAYGDSFAERELRARGRYAENALAALRSALDREGLGGCDSDE